MYSVIALNKIGKELDNSECFTDEETAKHHFEMIKYEMLYEKSKCINLELIYNDESILDSFQKIW